MKSWRLFQKTSLFSSVLGVAKPNLARVRSTPKPDVPDVLDFTYQLAFKPIKDSPSRFSVFTRLRTVAIDKVGPRPYHFRFKRTRAISLGLEAKKVKPKSPL